MFWGRLSNAWCSSPREVIGFDPSWKEKGGGKRERSINEGGRTGTYSRQNGGTKATDGEVSFVAKMRGSGSPRMRKPLSADK